MNKRQKEEKKKAEEIEEVEDENAIIPKPMEPSQQSLSSFDELIKERKEAPLGPKMTTLKKKINNQQVKTAGEILEKQKCLKNTFLRSNWTQHLPKNTKLFSFDPKSSDCNFQLLILILKDFNTNYFRKITSLDIKRMLIYSYRMLLKYPSKSKPLFEKWGKEYKKHYVDMLKSNPRNIDNIIMDENYKITKTDILLLSYKLNIPITILYQAKKQIKSTSFMKYNEKHDYRYYIKSTKSLYLYIRKNNIRFDNDKISEEMNQKIIDDSHSRFEDYLLTKFRS